MTLEELKQELQDCIMSNELLDKENDRLRRQNKEMFKQHQDYFVENEKLKQVLRSIKTQLEIYFKNKTLSPITKSEMLLDAFYQLLNEKQYQHYFVENDRLKQSEEEAQEIIAELESKLAEYEKFGLNKDLENLKRLK